MGPLLGAGLSPWGRSRVQLSGRGPPLLLGGACVGGACMLGFRVPLVEGGVGVGCGSRLGMGVPHECH